MFARSFFEGVIFLSEGTVIKAKTNAADVAVALQRAERQVPYATSLALTRTAYAVRDALIEKMPQVFDRPTPYTLRSMRVSRATKYNLTSDVRFKDRSAAGKGVAATDYLWPQVHGGGRNKKRYEKALGRVGPSTFYIPAAGAEYDAYGNMSRGQIVKLLSYLQAFGEEGYRANSTDLSRKRTAKIRKGEGGYKKINGVMYFISRGKGSMSGNREQRLPAGVWAKTGTHGADVKPILIATNKEPQYAPQLPFYETAEEIYGQRFEDEFGVALDRAMETAF